MSQENSNSENNSQNANQQTANPEIQVETPDLADAENSLQQNNESSDLDKKIAQLEQKNAELHDQFMRAQADMQNMQKRHHEDSKKTREYAISSFAKDLVQVKDFLEMALKDQSGSIETIKVGVDLTLKQLAQVFENNKIKEIIPQAKDKLDPHLHQAINTVEVENQEANTVVEVMQKGYILHDRVLRPAMVTVAK
jgi:molecular chaperone GrpE